MKTIRLILLWLFIALLTLPVMSFAEQDDEPTAPTEETPAPSPSPRFIDTQKEEREAAQQKIVRSAKANGYYVADANDLSVAYFSRNPNKQYPPGSTTKIMTALLSIEALSMDETAVAPPEATRLGGTNTMLGLATGEEMRVEDLLYGLMLVSGNDCAITLAFKIAGSEPDFAKLMNARAETLGMKNTNFTNPCGRNVGDNHSSPYDLALLTQDAIKNEQFLKIVGTANYTIPTNPMRKKETPIKNSDRLVSDAPGKGYHYPYAIGVKTGATALGTCLVNAAKKEDVTIICVQMGMLGDDNEARRVELWRRAIQFFDYVFEYEYKYVDAYTMTADYTTTIPVENVSVDDPEGGMLTLRVAPSDTTVYRPLHEILALTDGSAEFTVTADAQAVAPIKEGDALGAATFSYGGRDWFTLPLIAARDVEMFVPTPTPTPIPTPEPTPTPEPLDIQEEAIETPTPVPTPSPVPTPVPTEEPKTVERDELIKIGTVAVPALLVLIAAAIVLVVLKRKQR